MGKCEAGDDMSINNLIISYPLQDFLLMLNCPAFQFFWGFAPHNPCFSASNPAELTSVPYISRLAPDYRPDAPTRMRK